MKGGSDFNLTDTTQKTKMETEGENNRFFFKIRDDIKPTGKKTDAVGRVVAEAGIGAGVGAALGAGIGGVVGGAKGKSFAAAGQGALVGSSLGAKAGATAALGAGMAYDYYHNIPPKQQENIKKALHEMKKILDLNKDITEDKNIDAIGGLIIGNAVTSGVEERKPLAVLRRHFTNMGTSEDMLGVLYPVTEEEEELRQEKGGSCP